MLNLKKLYKKLTLRVYALGVKRQFLAQVTEPQAFVIANCSCKSSAHSVLVCVGADGGVSRAMDRQTPALFTRGEMNAKKKTSRFKRIGCRLCWLRMNGSPE
jgi:hypothetical protein